MFVTGFCADACGLPRVHYEAGFSPYKKHTDHLVPSDVVIHHMGEDDQRRAWERFAELAGEDDWNIEYHTEIEDDISFSLLK